MTSRTSTARRRARPPADGSHPRRRPARPRSGRHAHRDLPRAAPRARTPRIRRRRSRSQTSSYPHPFLASPADGPFSGGRRLGVKQADGVCLRRLDRRPRSDIVAAAQPAAIRSRAREISGDQVPAARSDDDPADADHDPRRSGRLGEREEVSDGAAGGAERTGKGVGERQGTLARSRPARHMRGRRWCRWPSGHCAPHGASPRTSAAASRLSLVSRFRDHRRWRGALSGGAEGARSAAGAPRDRDGNRQSVDSTIISVLPSGSRNQNIGGTGSPMRATCSSTSIPIDFM